MYCCRITLPFPYHWIFSTSARAWLLLKKMLKNQDWFEEINAKNLYCKTAQSVWMVAIRIGESEKI